MADGGGNTTGWQYTNFKDDEVESYGANGKLLSISNRAVVTRTLTYSSGTSNDTSASRYPAGAPVCSAVHPNVGVAGTIPAGRLLCVTDDASRQLNFQYDARGRIVKVFDPAGGQYLYEFDGVSGGCSAPQSAPGCFANNLTKISYPDSKTRIYHYNEAANINGGSPCSGTGLLSSLTGITDENGDRYATWTYDCQGRATSSQHAGGNEKVTFAFNGDGTTTVANYVGNPAAPTVTSRKYSFQTSLGVAKTTGIVDLATSQPAPCAGCGPYRTQSYDANGNVASRTDWNGNRTNYSYDLARNLETSRTEGLTSAGAATAATRTIETAWHAAYRLPTQVVEKNSAGTALRTTAMTYDASGNLLTRTVTDNPSGNSRSWNYTYNAFGQTLTVDGPRTDLSDVTTYA